MLTVVVGLLSLTAAGAQAQTFPPVTSRDLGGRERRVALKPVDFEHLRLQ